MSRLHFYTSPKQKTVFELNKPKYYADFCLQMPNSYSNYANHTIVYNDSNRYEFHEKLGNGEFATVYAAINKETGEKVAIKVLKPIEMGRVNREIMVMQALQGGENVIQILDVIKDPNSSEPAFVMEFVESGNITFKDLYHNFTDFDVRYYIYQLLKALDFAHSRGIEHRDVKPQNIVIDHPNRKFRLVDWGLAEFYIPGKNYTPIVSTRYFKGPELLVGMHQYDYAVDVWATGCVFSAMLFRRMYMFTGKDNSDQLEKIIAIRGSNELFEYVKKYNVTLHKEYEGVLMYHSKKPWKIFINVNNTDLAHAQALDLLDQMFIYDHALRITPKDAMKHPYFDPIKEYERNKAQVQENAQNNKEWVDL